MPPFNLSKLPRQTSSTAIVTGANSGVGYYTSRGLAQSGVHVVMACRNLERAHEAQAKLQAEVPNGTFEVMQVDTSKLDSVRSFAKAYQARYDKLDLLINNAGIMAVPQDYTEEGFERQLATNHLGHFALTGLLLDQLEAAPAARVVSLSSIAHRRGVIDFHDLQSRESYDPTEAYSQSKLACLMFGYELERRLRANGCSTQSLIAHPGVSPTNLFNGMPWYVSLAAPLFKVMGHKPPEAAKPSLMAALHPNLKGGAFIGPEGFREMSGDPGQVSSTDASKDEAAAAQLWEASEELTRVRYLDGSPAVAQ